MRRVERLVELGQEALNGARAAAVAATRAVVEARAIAQREEQRWTEAATGFAKGVTRAPELDQQAAHLRTLRLHADAAARAVDRAVVEETKRNAAVVKAAMDHRKLELWRDRISLGEREEEDRLERVAADELAARVTRMRA
ncbi:MAG TPA: hypothetical protein VGM06_14310 [Polyangiaceae bacterium]